MKLDSEEAAYEDIAAIIEDLEGVLEHGMLLNIVTEAVVVGIDGPVTLTKVWSSGLHVCRCLAEMLDDIVQVMTCTRSGAWLVGSSIQVEALFDGGVCWSYPVYYVWQRCWEGYHKI